MYFQFPLILGGPKKEEEGYAVSPKPTVLETTIVLTSRPGNHGVIKRLALPQNHGPLFKEKSSSFHVSNYTIKNSFEHK